MKSSDHRYILAIVGNGACPVGSAEQIDSATRVARFGDAAGLGGFAGNRVDDLTVVNRGVVAKDLLEDEQALARQAIRAARRIILPLDRHSIFLAPSGGPRVVKTPTASKELDYSNELRSRLRSSCRAVTSIDASMHEQACRELGLSIGSRARERADYHLPSGAFIALYWYVQGLPKNWLIELYGCEHGIDSASAANLQELAWIRRMEQTGRVAVLPAISDRAA